MKKFINHFFAANNNNNIPSFSTPHNTNKTTGEDFLKELKDSEENIDKTYKNLENIRQVLEKLLMKIKEKEKNSKISYTIAIGKPKVDIESSFDKEVSFKENGGIEVVFLCSHEKAKDELKKAEPILEKLKELGFKSLKNYETVYLISPWVQKNATDLQTLYNKILVMRGLKQENNNQENFPKNCYSDIEKIQVAKKEIKKIFDLIISKLEDIKPSYDEKTKNLPFKIGNITFPCSQTEKSFLMDPRFPGYIPGLVDLKDYTIVVMLPINNPLIEELKKYSFKQKIDWNPNPINEYEEVSKHWCKDNESEKEINEKLKLDAAKYQSCQLYTLRPLDLNKKDYEALILWLEDMTKKNSCQKTLESNNNNNITATKLENTENPENQRLANESKDTNANKAHVIPESGSYGYSFGNFSSNQSNDNSKTEETKDKPKTLQN